MPKAVPLTALRVGDGLIVTLPGEPTAEVGERLRAAVRESTGLDRVVVSGLAGEFIQYLTTPEEYDRQHYEGGSTLYGPLSSNLLRQELVELSRRLMRGEPPRPRIRSTRRTACRRTGRPTTRVPQPEPPPSSRRVWSAASSRPPSAGGARRTGWTGRWGARSWSSSAEREAAGTAWTATSALACCGRSTGRAPTALWEVPRTAAAGRYRLQVRAERYRLTSLSFGVRRARTLTVRPAPAPAGQVAVALDYPAAVRDHDLRHRPSSASGGVVRFQVGDRTVVVRQRRGTMFTVDAGPGTPVSIPAGAARDQHGNVNGAAFALP